MNPVQSGGECLLFGTTGLGEMDSMPNKTVAELLVKNS